MLWWVGGKVSWCGWGAQWWVMVRFEWFMRVVVVGVKGHQKKVILRINGRSFGAVAYV